MRLTDCEIFVVGNPPPGKGGRYFIFVRLETACNVVGYGEIYAATFSPHVVKAMAEDLYARVFEGADPHHIEHLWRRAYGSGYTARPDASLVGVLSGLEMACWDIVGKAAGQPLHRLFGSTGRERLRAYTYLYAPGESVVPDGARSVYTDPDLAAEAAAHAVAEGWSAIKFDPAGPYTIYDGRQPDLATLERAEAFCKRLREAVGTRADLLFGTHGQFTPSGAKRLARRIEPYEPLWFEEPCPPENPAAMAEVARATAVPIATGERLVTAHEFAAVLRAGAASILQPALGRVGGLSQARRLAALAEAHHAQVAPHLYAGPIAGAANVQLALSIPNFLILESIGRWDGFHAQILKTPMRCEDGHVLPPDAPGLGVELDEDVARAHPYTGTALHLEMAVTPEEASG
ncbi:MAG: mandelate racemase/muconate lactonizing enzyme family protein [Pseudomonadota bacterium]